VNLTLSPPIKILALVGLIGVLGLGASTLVLGHGTPTVRTSTATPHGGALTTPATVKASTPAKTTPASVATKHHATATPAKKHATVTKPVTKPVTKTTAPAQTAAKARVKAVAASHAKTQAKAVAHRASRGNLVYEDLPKQLQWQLAQHKIVVVSLYNPHADVDAISVAEAHAGATATKAGFLLVNVLDNSIAGLLTGLLPGGGLLPDPGVLVYRAPGDIMVRLDGFADRDSVAQAVTNALAGPKITPAASLAAVPAATPVTPAAPATTGAPTP
jgi:hypothetical protein